MHSIPSYYSILGVPSTASQREIVVTYRALAQRLHPDHNAAPDAEEQFVTLCNAYHVLGHPRCRAEYNADRTGQRSMAHNRDKSRPRRPPAHSPSVPCRRSARRQADAIDGLLVVAAMLLRDGRPAPETVAVR